MSQDHRPEGLRSEPGARQGMVATPGTNASSGPGAREVPCSLPPLPARASAAGGAPTRVPNLPPLPPRRSSDAKPSAATQPSLEQSGLVTAGRASTAAPLLPSVAVSEEPAQQRDNQPHRPGKGFPWAGLGLGVLAACLVGGGSWWWINAPQRQDGQKVTALEANVAELTKQTAELKAALDASKREAGAEPSPATASPSAPGGAGQAAVEG